MFILDVIQTIRIPKTDIQILSYFSKEPLPAGALARVPLGSRKINALVVDSHDLEKQRIQIKQSRFQTKNISAVISKEPVLNTTQLQLLKYLADYYIASPALFVSAMLPGYLINKKTPAAIAPTTPSPNHAEPNQSSYLTIVTSEDRVKSAIFKPTLINKRDCLKEYEKIISSRLSDGKQVLLLAPELARVEYYENYFSGYNPLILTSELTPKRFFESWDKIRLGQTQIFISNKKSLFSKF